MYTDLLKRLPPLESTCWFQGSGTGKELVARAIHYSSKTGSGPFVTVNCTAIPDSLLESELFGHVKGAFTGAQASRAGFFQIADGGTLLLDEIGDASLSMQGKLLRAIQNKEIFMVGSSRVQKIDTRIIAATNTDLNRLVQKSLFREDLYFRLNVIEISLPPLHERGEDILLLVQLFMEKLSKDMNRPAPRFSDKVLQIFKNYRLAGQCPAVYWSSVWWCWLTVILSMSRTCLNKCDSTSTGAKVSTGP